MGLTIVTSTLKTISTSSVHAISSFSSLCLERIMECRTMNEEILKSKTVWITIKWVETYEEIVDKCN